MVLRTFNGSDILTLPGMWKKDQPYLRMSAELFLKKIVMEPSFDPEGLILAEADGNPVGFVYAVCRRVPICAELPMEEKQGWIAGFCISDKSRVPEFGAALLDAAEAFLRKQGKSDVSTGFYPQYFSQGVEPDVCPEYVPVFEKAGYRPARSYSLSLNTADYTEAEDIPARRKALEENGFHIGALRPEWVGNLLDPAAPFSNASWACEFKARLEPMDFGRFRVAVKDGRIVGVAPFGDPGSDLGRFGPYGVDAAFRGMGIGKVLLADCLAEVKRRNIPEVWMQWVQDSGPAYHLYTQAGFRKKNTFLTFEKTL